MAHVVHCRRTTEPYTYIGRPSIYGNPFSLIHEEDRSEVIRKFKGYFNRRLKSDPEFKAKVLALQGQNLGCFCAPRACHGDVILAYLKRVEKAHG